MWRKEARVDRFQSFLKVLPFNKKKMVKSILFSSEAILLWVEKDLE